MAKINEDLLATLRCPVTNTKLRQEGDELVSEGKGADGQPLRYLIDEGIPLLLRPEQLS